MSQQTMDRNAAGGTIQEWQAGTKLDSYESGSTSLADLTDASEISKRVVGRDVGNYRGVASRGRAAISPCPLWKRTMDVVGAVTALVVLSPLLLAIAVFIKCVSRGPVFFRQQRFGVAGKPFTLWKFRSIEVVDDSERHCMYVSDLMENDRPLEKLDGKLPIITGGRLLRRLGLDELPQLFNVLIGEMSLVGPRPDVVPPLSYRERHRRRFDVKPGITGLWQVSGKNQTTFSTMMRMDIAYVRRRSFWLDAVILLRTIPAVTLN